MAKQIGVKSTYTHTDDTVYTSLLIPAERDVNEATMGEDTNAPEFWETHLVNLTPHDLNVFDGEGDAFEYRIPQSGYQSRVSMNTEVYDGNHYTAGITTVTAVYGEVTGLPAPTVRQNVVFVVSKMVLARVPSHPNLVATGENIRGEGGKVIGCRGFSL